MKLLQLCFAIEAGYAAEKSGLDDDMVPLIIELADNTELIRQLIGTLISAQAGLQWYQDTNPGQRDGSDDEMNAEIEQVLTNAGVEP